MQRTSIVLLAALIAAVAIHSLADAAPVTIEHFAPQGSVKAPRQVSVLFSAPMVALGTPRQPAPFDVQCPAPGNGRWIDARRWVYDFDADLPGGLRCRFDLRPGLTAAGGAPLAGPRSFAFDTGGPSVRASLPRAGEDAIDEEQVFVLAPDAPVDAATVSAHAWCRIEGRVDRVGVRVLAGTEREALLARRRALGYQYHELVRPGAGYGERIADADLARAEQALVLLQCRSRLPPQTAVDLVWGAGIATAGGVSGSADQRLSFRTRAQFTASITCERANARAQCLPLGPLTLSFSAPVPARDALRARLRDRQGRVWMARPAGGADAETVEEVEFEGPFPERASFSVELPADLRDDAGRALANAARFPLAVGTDAYPPLARFAGEFGVIEARAGGVLPVTLRNVEADLQARQAVLPAAIPGRQLRVADDDAAIARWLRRVQDAMEPRGEWVGPDASRWVERTGDAPLFEAADDTAPLSIPRTRPERDLEVVGIPLGTPGFYVVELASPRLGRALLGRDSPRYVATAALVTNLAVHFKWGRESSRIWVTALDSGRPVADADVAISGYCDGAPLWRGRTGADGIARVDAPLPAPHGWPDCAKWHAGPLIVSARTGADMSFTVSSWSRGIQPGDFGLDAGSPWQSLVLHSVLDRSLLRAGETVSMKHFARRRTMGGFAVPVDLPDPATLVIQHRGTDQRYTFQVDFDAAGIAQTRWSIPADARLGDYDLRFRIGDRTVEAGALRVEQFRVPLSRGSIQEPAAPLVGARSVTLDLAVGYLSGGGAGGMPVKLRTLIEPAQEAVPGYADYVFGGEEPREGLRVEGAGWDPFSAPRDASPAASARVIPVTLDAGGAARVVVDRLPAAGDARRLVAELEYADPNGEIQSVTRSVPLWPAALRVGLRTEGWAAQRDRLRFRAVVLDLKGQPLAGRWVSVDVFEITSYSYRRRLVGGFYTYENSTRTRRGGEICAGRTDATGLLACDVAAPFAGQAALRAVVLDDAGRPAIAAREAWIPGADEGWLGGGAGDRMDVLADRREYAAGEVAHLQVRSPFRSATALVSVEREGVLDAWVTTISGASPVVQVPIRPEYGPNAYVSVLAVRGRVGWWWTWIGDLARRLHLPWRVDGGAPTGLVDLSRPAFRLGFARIEVGAQPHRLEVEVKPDAQVYRGGRAKVRVAVRRADGGALSPGAEIALAAVDEGLLDLKPNASWNLLERMLGTRGIEVFTSTAQMQVVGKRHYGRKAVPHGGGGGRAPARELGDTLLAWHARIPLDARGGADVVVPLGDTLSAVRIVAVASAGAQWFGTGAATVRTRRDLMIFGGPPPQVRAGDRFAAPFTLRNASTAPLQVQASATLDSGIGAARALAPRQLTLAPGQARTVTWEVDVPADAAALRWEVAASARGATAADRLVVRQAVQPAVPVRVQQAVLAQVGDPSAFDLRMPAGGLPGRGGVEVRLRARLAGALDGVREYMRDYPYDCLEQRLSRAIALGDDDAWQASMQALPAYLDRDGLLRYFAADAVPGSDVLTAYVLSLAHAAGRPIPEPAAQRMLSGLRAYLDGRLQRVAMPGAVDDLLRRLAAIEALSRYGQARASDLDAMAVEPQTWPVSALLDWWQILDRVREIPDRDMRRAQAQDLLRARMVAQGSMLGFAGGEAPWWLMVSADVNAVRAVLALMDAPQWRADLPRLANGALARMARGHWDTTTANAWGTLAMARFGAAFEAGPVGGSTQVALGEDRRALAWPAQGDAPATQFPWPAAGAARIEMAHRGSGRPWALVSARAAVPLAEPLSAGFSVRRSLAAVERQDPKRWSAGDVVRVSIDVASVADMAWVVVDDPVPAGASILGTGLGRDSALLTRAERRDGAAWPAYEERRADAFRAYYAYLPRGALHIEYTLRLNTPGHFVLPATRVEAMYAPEAHGEWPNPAFEIGPGR
ncbi:MAG: alpha-2-macroglobulin [Gammaproteobacteria bacterium]